MRDWLAVAIEIGAAIPEPQPLMRHRGRKVCQRDVHERSRTGHYRPS